jgi:hypothetical protein
MRIRLIARKVIAVALATAALVLGTSLSASANTISYSAIHNCYFDWYNYVPVRLVIESSGTWRKLYRVQAGTVIASNSEVLTQVFIEEYAPASTQQGATYIQNLGAVTSYVSPILSTGYAPWIGRGTSAYGDVVFVNEHGNQCEAFIQF